MASGRQKGPLLLAVDLGNTRAKAALFDRDKCLASWSQANEAPDFEKKLTTWARTLQAPERLVICRVNRSQLSSFRRVFKKSKILQVEEDLDIPLSIRIPSPQTIGRDRLAGALAAWQMASRRGPLLTIDMGSAITFNLLDNQGAFIGGLITAGPGLVAKTLASKTEQLPEVFLKGKTALSGLPTEGTIRSGILLGAAAMSEGLVVRYRKEIGIRKIFVTGGGYELLRPYLQFKHIYVEDLVLRGVAATADARL